MASQPLFRSAPMFLWTPSAKDYLDRPVDDARQFRNRFVAQIIAEPSKERRPISPLAANMMQPVRWIAQRSIDIKYDRPRHVPSVPTWNGEDSAILRHFARTRLADPDAGLPEGACLAVDLTPVRKLIFPYRKNGGDLLQGRAREALYRMVRPTGNLLPGYTPSYAMNRVMEDAIG